MFRIAAMLVLSVLFAGSTWSAEQQLGSDEYGVSASSRPTYSLDAAPKISRLDFEFRAGESTAWLLANGDFHLHGWITQRGLLCATYRMGVRFGIGAPGCLNVEWLTEPDYVTSQFQCNGARVEHDGGDSVPEFGGLIAKITCAERVVRCSGACR